MLFTLLYLDDHKLNHNIDVMHTEKNVTDNIMDSMLESEGMTKDKHKACLDKAMGI